MYPWRLCLVHWGGKKADTLLTLVTSERSLFEFKLTRTYIFFPEYTSRAWVNGARGNVYYYFFSFLKKFITVNFSVVHAPPPCLIQLRLSRTSGLTDRAEWVLWENVSGSPRVDGGSAEMRLPLKGAAHGGLWGCPSSPQPLRARQQPWNEIPLWRSSPTLYNYPLFLFSWWGGGSGRWAYDHQPQLCHLWSVGLPFLSSPFQLGTRCLNPFCGHRSSDTRECDWHARGGVVVGDRQRASLTYTTPLYGLHILM